MSEVLGRAVIEMADNARRIDVPVASALARVPFSEDELRDPLCRIPWSAFAAFLDELEDASGGPEGFAQVVGQVQPMLFSNVFPLLRFLLSPRDLYRMIHTALGFVYLHIKVSEAMRSDGALVVTIDIPEPHRPCAAFFHACKGGMRTVPLILGQPEVDVSADLSERRGVFTIALAESKTLVARVRRASVSFLLKSAVAEVERSWMETRRRVAELEMANQRLVELTARLEAEAALRNHAEIALRAAEEAFAGARFRLTEDGTLVKESEAALTFAERLEKLALAWKLTPRHVEVTSHVVRGLSNKDIAARLACAVHTVELHVTEVLKRSGLESRSAVAAAFWSE